MKNESNVRIYGGDDSTVWAAPKGTTLPDDLTDLVAPFEDAGFLSPDGTEQTTENEVVEVKAHQGGRIVRTKVTGRKDTFKFTCTETNAVTIGLLSPAATITTTAGVTKIADQEKDARDERVFIIDEYDEEIQKRVVYSRAEVTSRGAIAHKSGEPTLYEFTVTSYGAIYTLTNDPALAVEA